MALNFNNYSKYILNKVGDEIEVKKNQNKITALIRNAENSNYQDGYSTKSGEGIFVIAKNDFDGNLIDKKDVFIYQDVEFTVSSFLDKKDGFVNVLVTKLRS